MTLREKAQEHDRELGEEVWNMNQDDKDAATIGGRRVFTRCTRANYTVCTFCWDPAVAACGCGVVTCSGCSRLPVWMKHECFYNKADDS